MDFIERLSWIFILVLHIYKYNIWQIGPYIIFEHFCNMKLCSGYEQLILTQT